LGVAGNPAAAIRRDALMNQNLTISHARIPDASTISGLSRSSLYRLAGSRHIRMVKSGKATLVDMGSVHAYLAALPEARISAAA
jgi:hypothetical protein